MNNESRIDVLKKLMRDNNLSQADLAKKTGRVRSNISEWLNNKRKISGDVIEELAGIFGTDTFNLFYNCELDINNGIPCYDIDFCGGFMGMYSDNTLVPTGNINLPMYKDATAVVNLTGNSMSPLIESGDKIIIKSMPNWEYNLLFGEIYGIEYGDNVRTVKKIRNGTNDAEFILEPINKEEYDSTPIRKDSIKSVWRVLGTIKHFS